MSLSDRANFFRPTLLDPANIERTGDGKRQIRPNKLKTRAAHHVVAPATMALNALSQTAKVFACHRGHGPANTAKKLVVQRAL
jgi:hypothetical protein